MAVSGSAPYASGPSAGYSRSELVGNGAGRAPPADGTGAVCPFVPAIAMRRSPLDCVTVNVPIVSLS